MFKKEEKSVSIGRVILITAGAVLVVLAALAVIYKFFKKHFKITFECGDCDFCEDGCLCEDADYEPECCAYDGCCCDDSDDDAADDAEDAADAE